MPFGVCKMCLQEKNLVSSHLIPRKIYEYCNQKGHNPIVLAGDVLMASDRQWQYPLLCLDCEKVLNDDGENWSVTKLATFEKTFPLYDLVSAKPRFQRLLGPLCYRLNFLSVQARLSRVRQNRVAERTSTGVLFATCRMMSSSRR
jgi:hypothetical protein